jgi:hypothetical protein
MYDSASVFPLPSRIPDIDGIRQDLSKLHWAAVVGSDKMTLALMNDKIGVAGASGAFVDALGQGRTKTVDRLKAMAHEILEWVAFAVELQDALSTAIRLDAIEIEGKT